MWFGALSSLASKRFCLHLLIAVLSKINPSSDDPEQLKNITIDLSHLKIQMGLVGNDTVSLLKNAIRDIMHCPIDIEVEGESYTCLPFFDAPRIDFQTRLITVSIYEDFKPYITQLKEFLEIKGRALGLTQRALIFYSVIKSKHAKTPKKIYLDELQTKCQVNYANYGAFKQKYLIPVIQDLKNNDIHVEFKEGLAGRRVEFLSFTIQEPQRVENAPQIEAETPYKPSIANTETPGVQILEIFEHYRQKFKPTVHNLTPKRKNAISVAIKKYGLQNCKKAIDNMLVKQKDDEWLKKNATIDHLFNSPEVTEKYINLTTNDQPEKQTALDLVQLRKLYKETFGKEPPEDAHPYFMKKDIEEQQARIQYHNKEK